MINIINFVNKDTFLVFSILLLIAFAALISERSGIINIALEGQLIAGVLGYTMVGYFLNDVLQQDYWRYLVGLTAAIIFCLFVTAIFAFFVVYVKMNQILTALAMNIIMFGLASFVIVSIKNNTEFVLKEDYVWLYVSKIFKTYLDLKVGGFGIEIIYQFFFVLLIIFIIYIFLFRTTWGLRLRSCGEDPKISLMNGIAVKKYRFGALIAGGFLIGFAGTLFAEWKPGFSGSVDGYGYLGLAMLILGMRNIALISFLVGLFVVLQTFIFSLSGSSFHELLNTINYALPLLVLVIYGTFFKPKSGKNAPPQALSGEW